MRALFHWSVLLGLLVEPREQERLVPPVPLVDFAGTEARSLDDFLGQAVLLDFFAHWCAPCARLVPHLNEIEEEHGGRGLNVLGVTGDDAATAEKWLAELGATYAHARDEGLRMQIELGFRALPFAVLIDPTGVIVWSGNPKDLAPEAIERALHGALELPAQRWPGEAEPLRDALAEGRFGEAARLAPGVPGLAPELARFVEHVVARRMELLESRLAAGDFLTADELAAGLEKGLEDGERRTRAAAVRARIAADDGQRVQLEALAELRELWRRVGEVSSTKAADELAAEIRLIAADHTGTFVERRASEHLAAIESLKTIL